MEAILAVASKLAAPFDLRTMLSEVVNAAKRVLRADRGSVWLYDPAINWSSRSPPAWPRCASRQASVSRAPARATARSSVVTAIIVDATIEGTGHTATAITVGNGDPSRISSLKDGLRFEIPIVGRRRASVMRVVVYWRPCQRFVGMNPT